REIPGAMARWRRPPRIRGRRRRRREKTISPPMSQSQAPGRRLVSPSATVHPVAEGCGSGCAEARDREPGAEGPPVGATVPGGVAGEAATAPGIPARSADATGGDGAASDAPMSGTWGGGGPTTVIILVVASARSPE